MGHFDLLRGSRMFKIFVVQLLINYNHDPNIALKKFPIPGKKLNKYVFALYRKCWYSTICVWCFTEVFLTHQLQTRYLLVLINFTTVCTVSTVHYFWAHNSPKKHDVNVRKIILEQRNSRTRNTCKPCLCYMSKESLMHPLNLNAVKDILQEISLFFLREVHSIKKNYPYP